jgi:hypothetical protein
VGVTVVLTAAAPAHASPAAGSRNRCAMRVMQLPTKHRLGAHDTGNSLSRHYYGNRGGALTILSSIRLKKWRPSTSIVASKRYQVGDTIVIPKPPRASINPPQRSTQA